MSISKLPSTNTVTYAAGSDCLRVDVGVMGERKDRTSLAGFEASCGEGMEYDKFVVEASYLAPRYMGNETLYLSTSSAMTRRLECFLPTRRLLAQEAGNLAADPAMGRPGRMPGWRRGQRSQSLGLSRTWAICSMVRRGHRPARCSGKDFGRSMVEQLESAGINTKPAASADLSRILSIGPLALKIEQIGESGG